MTHDIVITSCVRCHRLSFSSSINFYISRLVGMFCEWCSIFFFLYRKSTTETRGVNREFYVVVVLCVGVWSVYFSTNFDYFLFIFIILFSSNEEWRYILSLLPFSWYKGSRWSPPSKSFYLFKFQLRLFFFDSLWKFVHAFSNS